MQSIPGGADLLMSRLSRVRNLAPHASVGLALLAGSVALVAAAMTRGSLEGDEAFYAGVALESSAAGRVYPLIVNGEPYIQKPPLLFWLQMLSMQLLGPSTSVARLPAALFGIGSLLLVFRFARIQWGPLAGGASSLLLASLPVALGVHGRHGLASGTGDSLLLFLLLSAMLTTQSWLKDGRVPSLSFALIAAAASPWAKGAVGPAFLFVAVPALLILGRHRSRRASPHRPRLAFGATLILVTPWISYFAWICSLHLAGIPNVWARVVGRGVLRRLTEGLNAAHLQGPTFYIETISADFGLAGLLLLAASLALFVPALRARSCYRLRLSLWLISVAWVAAISVPVSKLPWYALAAYPGLCWLAAWAIFELPRLLGSKHWRLAATVLAAVAALGPLLGTLNELRRPPILHSTEAVLLDLARRGEPLTWIHPELRFGRSGQLDATEYFLVQAAAHKLLRSSRSQPQPLAPCRLELWARHLDDVSPTASSTAEAVWQSPPKENGWRLTLIRRC